MSRATQSNSYLSTGDVIQLVGTTRRKLEECANKGIIEPFLSNATSNADRRWTFPQTRIAGYISDFRRHGMTLDDIAELTDKGQADVLLELKRLQMDEVRNARRSYKAISRYAQELDETQPLKDEQSYYLRYIPQRYFALTPILEPNENLGESSFMQLVMQLVNVSQTVGWCPISQPASLASFSADGNRESKYAAIELASKPDPRPLPDGDPDSGCYQIVSDQGLPLDCNKNCDLCTRFGRRPTDGEHFIWDMRARTQPTLYDKADESSRLGKTYTSGPWAKYSQLRRKGKKVDHFIKEELEDICAAVPRLMPCEVKLPYGVCAAVMPAGIYLCARYTEKDQTRAIDRTMGLTSAFSRKAITEEIERDISKALYETMSNQTFAQNKPLHSKCFAKNDEYGNLIGDPNLLGWHKSINTADLSDVELFVNAALAPEDGCCVICSEVPPTKIDDAPTFETQVLVNIKDPARDTLTKNETTDKNEV